MKNYREDKRPKFRLILIKRILMDDLGLTQADVDEALRERNIGGVELA